MKKKLFVLEAGILNKVSKKEAKKIGLIKMISFIIVFQYFFLVRKFIFVNWLL